MTSDVSSKPCSPSWQSRMYNIKGSHSLQPLWFSLDTSSQGYLCISTSYISAWAFVLQIPQADRNPLIEQAICLVLEMAERYGMQPLTISSSSSSEHPFSGALGALCKYLHEYSREVWCSLWCTHTKCCPVTLSTQRHSDPFLRSKLRQGSLQLHL